MHPAWTFAPATFHKWLEERIVEDDELRLDTLQELAMAAVAEATPITWHVLDSMRFDEEWLVEPDLDDPDADECYSERWYLMVLAPWLLPAPSPGGFWFFQKVLPLAGWSDEDIHTLNFGRQTGSLAREYGSKPVAAEFGDIWDYGWIDLIEVEQILSRLEADEDLLLSPPWDEMKEIADFARSISRDPAQILEKTYRATQRTLLTAVERQEALLTILR
jgi:hypothetical protein